MAPIKNGRLIFNEVPTGFPIPGQTTIYDSSSQIDLEAPLNGGRGSILIKTIVLSVDPYMRGKMRDVGEWGYSPAYTLGEPIQGLGIGKVIRSENEKFKEGDYVYGMIDYAEYSIPKDVSSLKTIVKQESTLPWSAYVGVLGMPGQTAYYGWKEYSEAKKGETVFVSTGAGPVGSLVIQLAKADGLKVITSTGSDEKVEFCKSIGADVAFNYKKESTEEVLGREGPIHVYWDNVGGSTLDAALKECAVHARFISCGMIGGSNNRQDGFNMKYLWHIYAKRITLHGLLVWDLSSKYEKEFFSVVPKGLVSGEFEYKEDVVRGLEGSGEAILDVLVGGDRNGGKKVVLVWEG